MTEDEYANRLDRLIIAADAILNVDIDAMVDVAGRWGPNPVYQMALVAAARAYRESFVQSADAAAQRIFDALQGDDPSFLNLQLQEMGIIRKEES